MYKYIDGNGNKYILHNEPNKNIEYIPMKPHLSSSGIYDGGDYLKIEINSQEWEKLISILNDAIRKKEIHIKKRIKQSGQIIILDKNKIKTFIIKPNSKELLEIENFLHGIIQK